MTSKHDEREIIDAIRLQRLVDGELTGDEYRATLRLLAASDDGWRRCALAFLEAQALSREFATLASRRESAASGGSASSPPVEPVELARDPASGREALWKLALATAASFLLAFYLGWAVQPFLSAPSVSNVAEHDSTIQVAGGDDTERRSIAAETDRSDRPAVADPGFDGSPGSVRLVLDNGPGERREVELPVRSFDEAGGQWHPDTHLPPQLSEILRAMGHDVHFRHQYVPVPLDDGSQLVVPIEQMRIVPIGERRYQ